MLQFKGINQLQINYKKMKGQRRKSKELKIKLSMKSHSLNKNLANIRPNRKIK